MASSEAFSDCTDGGVNADSEGQEGGAMRFESAAISQKCRFRSGLACDFRCGLELRVTLRPKSLAICGRGGKDTILDGRNRARVIAESLARVIVESLAFVGGHISLQKPQNLVLTDPVFVALRFESRDWRSFV